MPRRPMRPGGRPWKATRVTSFQTGGRRARRAAGARCAGRPRSRSAASSRWRPSTCSPASCSAKWASSAFRRDTRASSSDLATVGAGRDPVPRRPRGRGRAAAGALAGAAAPPRRGHAGHGDRGGAARARAGRSRLDRVAAARGAALADRPGAVLAGRDRRAGAGPGPPHAQPRVRDSTTGWRSPPCSPSRPPWKPGNRQLRVVALRAAGRGPGTRVRPRVRDRRLDADAARGTRRGERSLRRQKALYCFGLAFATYGITLLPPTGNGFIAVFVAAIVVGNRRAGPARVLRRERPGGRRDRQARDLRRVRLAVHRARAPARRLGRGRSGRGHAAARQADRDLRRPGRNHGSRARTRSSCPGSAPRAWPRSPSRC